MAAEIVENVAGLRPHLRAGSIRNGRSTWERTS